MLFGSILLLNYLEDLDDLMAVNNSPIRELMELMTDSTDDTPSIYHTANTLLLPLQRKSTLSPYYQIPPRLA